MSIWGKRNQNVVVFMKSHAIGMILLLVLPPTRTITMVILLILEDARNTAVAIPNIALQKKPPLNREKCKQTLLRLKKNRNNRMHPYLHQIPKARTREPNSPIHANAHIHRCSFLCPIHSLRHRLPTFLCCKWKPVTHLHFFERRTPFSSPNIRKPTAQPSKSRLHCGPNY